MLFIYMVKVAVYLVAFYLVYSVLLSRDTAYIRNRAFILISFISSLILPFLSFRFTSPLGIRFFGKVLSEVLVTGASNPGRKFSLVVSVQDLIQILYSVYFIIVIIFIIKLIVDLINLLVLIRHNKANDSRIIMFHGLSTSGFSALGYIFINKKLAQKDASDIIRHEQNHLKHNHFLDILFIEIIKAFQWFNPVIYLFNRSLRAIHEYQADQECLSSGIPVINYQNLLFKQVLKSGRFNLPNSFSNPSLIKKRMIMMTKKRTSAIANIKLILVLPVIAFAVIGITAFKDIPLLTNSVTGTTNSSSEEISPPPPPPPPPESKVNVQNEVSVEEEPFIVVDKMPMFPGGEKALLKFISENTRFPEKAKKQSIVGKVIIRFCITSTGKVNQISVLKGLSPELDTEAVRVVSTLPDFEPGSQGGRPVPVWFMVPIVFTLK
jgi:TonB family protein